jgi:hypothetical protein
MCLKTLDEMIQLTEIQEASLEQTEKSINKTKEMAVKCAQN